MKTTIKIEKEVDIKKLHVFAGVRYWEDSSVNGIDDDEDGNLIPCKVGNIWSPVIDVETGKIDNWQLGVSAQIHYKVCDQCGWDLIDDNSDIVISVRDEYVPDSLSPADGGYGDYMIMNIGIDGVIADWNFDIDDFIQKEDD